LKIKFQTNYKAVSAFETPELPDFVVITGKNGSGKSQLLELIYFKDPSLDANAKAKAKLPEAQKLTLIGFDPVKIKLTTFGGGSPQAVAAANESIITQLDTKLISILKQFKQKPTEQKTHESRLLKKISDFNNIQPSLLTEDHIQSYRYLVDDFEIKDIFTANISQIVVNYFTNFNKNIEATVAAEKYGANVYYLNKEEFDRKFPNPFVIINSVLQSAQIDYRLKEEKIENFFQKTNKSYEPIFESTRNGCLVKANDFSSGEKVLLSLAFSILNTSKFSGQGLPNLLLLDEIDASLHPSMVKQLIKVIEEELVAKYRIKVLMTTHSPSTVAIAPESSLFMLKKFGEEGDRFIKVDKRFAINQLLEGVRSIDLEVKNAKYVFTEARNDQYFLSSIYSSLRDRFDPDIHMNFIPSGVYDGNCDLVKATVQKLRESGNQKILGLIDWDSKNNDEDGVFVHSKNLMYSLENVILNPLFLGMLLIHENILKITDVFPAEVKPYYEVFKNEATQEKIEALARYVENLTGFDSQELIELELINGATVKFNKDFLHHQGHALETTLKEKIPALNRFNKNGTILVETIDRIIVHFSSLLPIDLLNTLLKIQNS